MRLRARAGGEGYESRAFSFTVEAGHRRETETDRVAAATRVARSKEHWSAEQGPSAQQHRSAETETKTLARLMNSSQAGSGLIERRKGSTCVIISWAIVGSLGEVDANVHTITTAVDRLREGHAKADADVA